MIQRIVAGILGLALLALMFVFVSFLLALAVTVGLLAGGWMWWRSRGTAGRRSVRHGEVIEGEYRVVRDQNQHLRR